VEIVARARVSGRSFYYFVNGETVYMIDAYPKNEKENLSHAETLSDSPRKSSAARKKKPKSTRLGRALIKGMTEVVAHIRGEIKLESYYLPGPVDVKAVRRRAGMSQAKFAAAFGLNRRTLQEWEQHKAEPDGAVRAYLTVIDRNPEAVIEALRG